MQSVSAGVHMSSPNFLSPSFCFFILLSYVVVSLAFSKFGESNNVCLFHMQEA